MKIKLLRIVVVAVIVGLSGCVLVTRKEWKEDQNTVKSLELENDVLHQRLAQMEDGMMELDKRVKAIEGLGVHGLDLCRKAGGIEAQVRCVARAKGFDENFAARVVKCESGFDPNIHGDWSRRRRKYLAHGLWQWHVDKHPELADNRWGLSVHDCAHDVVCSTDEAIDAINEGHRSWWTCITKPKRRHRRR